jgi:protein ImuB
VQEEGKVPAQPSPVADHSSRPPWPGHIPAPAPSVLIDPPREVQVLDAGGRCVTVTARGAVPTPPTRLIVGTGTPVAITAWAGPWPVDDNWWNRSRPGDGTPQQSLRRRARFQLVDVHGRAYLVTSSVPLSVPGGAADPAQTSPATAAVDPETAVQWTLDALYD